MNAVIKYIRKDEWSPYIAGILLGVVGVATVWMANTTLGASGGFENIAGMLGKAVAPGLFDNYYFKNVMRPEITFPVILLVGIFFGGMFGAMTSGTFKFRTMDDEQWKSAYGAQPWKRWTLLFVGAIILEYAAGIAGGCTSGLAISGGMLLAPSAFLFIAGMFASGIATAWLVYGKKY